MIKTTIYSVALGTIILSSGAIATPVINPTFTPTSSNAEMLNTDTKLYIVSYTGSQKLKLVSKTSSPQ
ncbi:MAG: hypothetical protein V7K14_09170, partial [Nostoc sp.]